MCMVWYVGRQADAVSSEDKWIVTAEFLHDIKIEDSARYFFVYSQSQVK